MRAQQCNAIWRTTRPLFGPCLNGVLNWHRCRRIVRVFVYGGRNFPRLSGKPDCLSDRAVIHSDEVIATAAHSMSRMGQSLPKRSVRAASALPSIATGQQISRIGSFVPKSDIGRLV
jgi:hypothetical protein